MKSYPKLFGKTLDAVHAWCQAVEKLRDDDRREVDLLGERSAPVRLLYSIVTPVGNVTTGEDDLMAYAVPPGLLAKDGWYLEIEAAFSTAANANNKRIRAYLGSTAIYDTTALALNDKDIKLRLTVLRAGASVERCGVEMASNDSTLGLSGFTYTDAAVALATLSTIKFTGEATSTNDIVQKYMTAKWFPANIEATS